MKKIISFKCANHYPDDHLLQKKVLIRFCSILRSFFDSQYQDAAILSWLRCLYWAESRVGWLIWTAWLPKSQKGLSCYIHVITFSTFSNTFDSILDLEINKIRNGFALKEIKGSRSELGWLSSITHHFHVRFSLRPASAAASAYLRPAGHAEVAAAPTGGETDMGWISQASLYCGNSWKYFKKTYVFLIEIKEHGTSWSLCY